MLTQTTSSHAIGQPSPSIHFLVAAAARPVTSQMLLLCGFQSKFKHLWDASEQSVRSAAAITPLEAPSTVVLAGALEHALSTRGVQTPRVPQRGVSDAEGMHAGGAHMNESAKQGLTGRWSSLFSRRSGLDDCSQHEDDLTGSNYMHRDY